VKIELDKSQIDAVTQAEITALRKEVASLERKLKTKENQLTALRDGMDVSKERRAKLRGIANDLMLELENAGWATYDERW
jgi:predicted  nucleic acid-binding Zn-ribbon protein